MNYRRIESPILATFMSLVVNALFIIIKKNNLKKFDAESDEGIFLGYSITSKAYMIFNKKTLVIEESIHVIFDESNNTHLEKNIEDDENILEDKVNESNEQVIQENKIENTEEAYEKIQDHDLSKS